MPGYSCFSPHDSDWRPVVEKEGLGCRYVYVASVYWQKQLALKNNSDAACVYGMSQCSHMPWKRKRGLMHLFPKHTPRSEWWQIKIRGTPGRHSSVRQVRRPVENTPPPPRTDPKGVSQPPIRSVISRITVIRPRNSARSRAVPVVSKGQENCEWQSAPKATVAPSHPQS